MRVLLDAVAAATAAAVLAGCAATGQRVTAGAFEQQIAAVRADVDRLENSILKMESTVNVHGDSISAWIYAVGAAIVYPVMRMLTGTWRPLLPRRKGASVQSYTNGDPEPRSRDPPPMSHPCD